MPPFLESGKYTGTEASAGIQLDRLSVYFDEVANKKYVPRSIQVDLEPAVLDNVKNGTMGNLFRPDTFVNVSCTFLGITRNGNMLLFPRSCHRIV